MNPLSISWHKRWPLFWYLGSYQPFRLSVAKVGRGIGLLQKLASRWAPVGFGSSIHFCSELCIVLQPPRVIVKPRTSHFMWYLSMALLNHQQLISSLSNWVFVIYLRSPWRVCDELSRSCRALCGAQNAPRLLRFRLIYHALTSECKKRRFLRFFY